MGHFNGQKLWSSSGFIMFHPSFQAPGNRSGSRVAPAGRRGLWGYWKFFDIWHPLKWFWTWYLKHPKNIPKTSQKHPKNIPKTSQKHPKLQWNASVIFFQDLFGLMTLMASQFLKKLLLGMDQWSVLNSGNDGYKELGKDCHLMLETAQCVWN